MYSMTRTRTARNFPASASQLSSNTQMDLKFTTSTDILLVAFASLSTFKLRLHYISTASTVHSPSLDPQHLVRPRTVFAVCAIQVTVAYSMTEQPMQKVLAFSLRST
eukprot:4505440-Pleurochrysis_carterae.AAC.1